MFMSYDRFTSSQDLRLTIKSDRKVKSGGRYSQVANLCACSKDDCCLIVALFQEYRHIREDTADFSQ